jgi:hypothetical protein
MRLRPDGSKAGSRPPGPQRGQECQACRGRGRTEPAPPDEDFLYVLQGGPKPGRTGGRLGACPALPLTLPRRAGRVAGRLARTRGRAAATAKASGRPPGWNGRRCRWPVPDLHGDPSRGLTTGHCGQTGASPRGLPPRPPGPTATGVRRGRKSLRAVPGRPGQRQLRPRGTHGGRHRVSTVAPSVIWTRRRPPANSRCLTFGCLRHWTTARSRAAAQLPGAPARDSERQPSRPPWRASSWAPRRQVEAVRHAVIEGVVAPERECTDHESKRAASHHPDSERTPTAGQPGNANSHQEADRIDEDSQQQRSQPDLAGIGDVVGHLGGQIRAVRPGVNRVDVLKYRKGHADHQAKDDQQACRPRSPSLLDRFRHRAQPRSHDR